MTVYGDASAKHKSPPRETPSALPLLPPLLGNGERCRNGAGKVGRASHNQATGRAAHGAGVTPGHIAVPLLGVASLRLTFIEHQLDIGIERLPIGVALKCSEQVLYH